jgi:nitrite reductase (NADH) large subunit
VDSGYEISVAGAAGMDVKETEFLCKVATEAEAMEVIAAFVQLYRENSRYLHRMYKWVAKVGLDWCKAQVVDDLSNRAALHARFQLSQSVYRADPWAEHAKDRAAWAPMMDLSREAAE